VGEQRGRTQLRLRRLGLRVRAERGDVHAAGAIDAVARVQARFVAEERDGVRGAHGRAVRANDGAAVRIQPARHVQRQHRAIDIGRAQRQRARTARERAREADAEQAVDDEAVAAGGVEVVDEVHAAGRGARQRMGRLRRRGRAGQVDHFHMRARGAEVGRDFQRIAAVVAGTGQHDDDAARHAAEQVERERGGRGAGPRHERAGRQVAVGGLLEGADLGDAVELGIHGFSERRRRRYLHFR
jgi:hypothetical protein